MHLRTGWRYAFFAAVGHPRAARRSRTTGIPRASRCGSAASRPSRAAGLPGRRSSRPGRRARAGPRARRRWLQRSAGLPRWREWRRRRSRRRRRRRRAAPRAGHGSAGAPCIGLGRARPRGPRGPRARPRTTRGRASKPTAAAISAPPSSGPQTASRSAIPARLRARVSMNGVRRAGRSSRTSSSSQSSPWWPDSSLKCPVRRSKRPSRPGGAGGGFSGVTGPDCGAPGLVIRGYVWRFSAVGDSGLRLAVFRGW